MISGTTVNRELGTLSGIFNLFILHLVVECKFWTDNCSLTLTEKLCLDDRHGSCFHTSNKLGSMDWSKLISDVTQNVMSKIVEVPSMTVCSSLDLEALEILLNKTHNVTDTELTDDVRARYSRQLKLGR